MNSKRLCRLYAGRDGLGLKEGDLVGELKESGQFELWAFGGVEVEQAAVRLIMLPEGFPLLRDRAVPWGTIGELRAKMAGFAEQYPRAVAITSRDGHLPGADDDLKDGLLPLTRSATGGFTVYRRVKDGEQWTNEWGISHFVTESGIWHETTPSARFTCSPESLELILQNERQRLLVERDGGTVISMGTAVDPTNGREEYWAKKS